LSTLHLPSILTSVLPVLQPKNIINPASLLHATQEHHLREVCMHTLLRQLLAAMIGGAVAAGVMLVASNTGADALTSPGIALAQTSATISDTVGGITTGSTIDGVDADARKMINYQGQVFNPNTGAPYANAGLNFSFRLYNNPAGTNQVFREDRFVQTNVDGFFSTNIGDTGSFDNVYSIFNGQELYLRVFINNQELTPLQPISFVPYAFWSVHAHHLDNYDADDFPKIIAHGVINANGSRRSGENFNSFRTTVADAEVYIIDLEGVDEHSVDDYTTIVTPACASPAIVGIGSSVGDLVVDVWDQNGTRIQCTFQFMTLQK
jgi:hypothetical protein